MKIEIIIYCLFILSICGKSININMNKFTIFQHRVRNTSMRVVVFNNIYKSLKEKILQILYMKENVLLGNYSPLISYYYDITYRYYSMDDEDRENLELIISLLI